MVLRIQSANARRETLLKDDVVLQFDEVLLAAIEDEDDLRRFVTAAAKDAVFDDPVGAANGDRLQLDAETSIGVPEAEHAAWKDVISAYLAQLVIIADSELGQVPLRSEFFRASTKRLADLLVARRAECLKALDVEVQQLNARCASAFDTFEVAIGEILQRVELADGLTHVTLAYNCRTPVQEYVVDQLTLRSSPPDLAATRFSFPTRMDVALAKQLITATDALVEEIWRIVSESLGTPDERRALTRLFIQEVGKGARNSVVASVSSPDSGADDDLGDPFSRVARQIRQLRNWLDG